MRSCIYGKAYRSTGEHIQISVHTPFSIYGCGNISTSLCVHNIRCMVVCTVCMHVNVCSWQSIVKTLRVMKGCGLMLQTTYVSWNSRRRSRISGWDWKDIVSNLLQQSLKTHCMQRTRSRCSSIDEQDDHIQGHYAQGEMPFGDCRDLIPETNEKTHTRNILLLGHRKKHRFNYTRNRYRYVYIVAIEDSKQ